MGAITYPLADRDTDGWYSDGDYEARGGCMIRMTPADYLAAVRVLDIDDASRDNIDDLKRHMIARLPLDPLKMYPDGREDGRHRAHAALELKVEMVPVVTFPPPVAHHTIGETE